MLCIILMHISRFMVFCLFVFATDLLLAVYFIFILDQENDVRPKSKFKQFSSVQNGS